MTDYGPVGSHRDPIRGRKYDFRTQDLCFVKTEDTCCVETEDMCCVENPDMCCVEILKILKIRKILKIFKITLMHANARQYTLIHKLMHTNAR